jgi:hypothetical protein
MSETFPRSCRDDHALIGWSGGGELCPLCVAQDRVAELEHLFRPRPYDNNSEAELCPVCNGALDDHRANCVVEMWQVGRACERITALEQRYAALVEAVEPFVEVAREITDDWPDRFPYLGLNDPKVGDWRALLAVLGEEDEEEKS